MNLAIYYLIKYYFTKFIEKMVITFQLQCTNWIILSDKFSPFQWFHKGGPYSIIEHGTPGLFSMGVHFLSYRKCTPTENGPGENS